MKDNRFIELLNLYIDRQITVAETAELEAEIQQNPKRQAVYRQYCHIHAATKLVYHSFRAEAAEQPVHPAGRAGVVELFETKRRRNQFAFFTASGLAAAACLAVVFMRHNTAPATVEPVIAARTAIRPAVPAVIAVAAPAPAKTMEPVIGPVSLRNSVMSTPDYTAMLAALREQDEERTMASVHLSNHVQSLFDDGLFNSNRVIPAQDPKLFRIQQTSAPQAETTVFQFQR
jgi:hypothetical protein